MIQTTSLETSNKIFELTGWKDTYFVWNDLEHNPLVSSYKCNRYVVTIRNDFLILDISAYDLAYLLERLPKRITVVLDLFDNKAVLDVFDGEEMTRIDADTPTEAAGLLTIKLAEQGLLKDK